MALNLRNISLVVRFTCGWYFLWHALAMRTTVNRFFSRPKTQFIRPPPTMEVSTRNALDNVPSDARSLSRIYVIGNSTSVNSAHPTIRLIMKRLLQGSKPGRRAFYDGEKVALCIEGGGMRGCISAGAAAALDFLGLNDAVDCVYGSSAGAMVGAYFISRQRSGLQIYHDVLPSAGRRFIDKSRLLNAAGIPTSALSPRKLRAFLASNTINRLLKTEQFSNDRESAANAARASVINLHFLLDMIMGETQALDWESFAANERVQPLNVVTTDADTLSSTVLTRSKGNCYNLATLLDCIRASMLVPGVTEPLMTLSSDNAPPRVSPALQRTVVEERKLAVNTTTIINATSDQEKRSEDMVSRSWMMLQQWMSEQLDRRNSQSQASFPLMQPTRVVATSPVKPRNNQSSFNGKVYFASLLSIRQRLKVFGHRPQKRMNESEHSNTSISHNQSKKLFSRQRDEIVTVNRSREGARLCDAFLAEPIPYRSAVSDGATHIIVLRTRPDPCKVLGKGPGVYEQLIARRYFQMQQANEAIDWLLNLRHGRVYAEDILTMNEAASGPVQGVEVEKRNVHILPIAVVDPDAKEIGQLETKRERILEGMRDGARRVLQIFLPEILALEEQRLPPKLLEALPDQRLNVTVESVLDMIFPLSILQRQVSMVEVLTSISLSKGDLI